MSADLNELLGLDPILPGLDGQALSVGPESSNDSSSEEAMWRNSRTGTPHSGSSLGQVQPHDPHAAPSVVPVDSNTYQELLKEQDVKKMRLARKAELARLSRKRKKSALEFLEGEVSRLQEELAEERRLTRLAEEKLAQSQEEQMKKVVIMTNQGPCALVASANLEEQVKDLSGTLRAMVQKGHADSGEAKNTVNKLYDLFKLQSLNSASSLSNVKKDLELALPLRFMEWAMSQPDKFFHDAHGLWRTLWLTDIGLSPAQFEQLVSLRPGFQAQRNARTEIENSYSTLCQLMESQLVSSSRSLDSLCSLLTPEQLAKFLAWVDTFGSICIRING